MENDLGMINVRFMEKKEDSEWESNPVLLFGTAFHILAQNCASVNNLILMFRQLFGHCLRSGKNLISSQPEQNQQSRSASSTTLAQIHPRIFKNPLDFKPKIGYDTGAS